MGTSLTGAVSAGGQCNRWLWTAGRAGGAAGEKPPDNAAGQTLHGNPRGTRTALRHGRGRRVPQAL